MRCFACDGEIELGTGERVGFRDTCDSCSADLHVCRNCELHDSNAYNECREANAERVSDRERSNRCEYFSPGDAGGGESAAAAAGARDALDALFRK